MTNYSEPKIEISFVKGRKTLWEKEKMLCTSIFFFCNVFRMFFPKGFENNGLYGKGLN